MTRKVAVAVVAVLTIGAVDALAQVGANQVVRQNASGGAIRERAPGQLVQAGIARAVETNNAFLAGVEIVDEYEPSLRAQVISESLQVVFQQVNNAIAAFHNLLLARAGRTPNVLPPDVFSDSSSTTDSGLGDLSGIDLGGLLDQFGLDSGS